MRISLRSLPRAFVHVDCDSFFASVEQAMNPALRGKPVIVGKDRGIAAAFSIEAKRFGVTRAMPLHEIKKICPNAIFLPCDYETYSLVSKRFYAIIRRFTPDVEEYSIDEAYAEITGLRRLYRKPYEAIAKSIKDNLEKELGISVSLGLSLSKSLAKICSKENKPSGFTCVKGYDLDSYLKTLPLERVCGFGPASCALLERHGLRNVHDYVSLNVSQAQKWLGKIGVELWHELRGQSVYAIQKDKLAPQASLSKTKTFTPASNDRSFVEAQLIRNMESAFIKLRRHKLTTKMIGVYLKRQDFHSESLGAKLPQNTDSPLVAITFVKQLLEKLYRNNTLYRSTGIWLSEIESRSCEYTGDLFEDANRKTRLVRINQAIDEAGAAYGKHTLHLGSSHMLSHFSQHLNQRGDTARRKTELLKGETFRQRLRIPLWQVKV